MLLSYFFTFLFLFFICSFHDIAKHWWILCTDWLTVEHLLRDEPVILAAIWPRSIEPRIKYRFESQHAILSGVSSVLVLAWCQSNVKWFLMSKLKIQRKMGVWFLCESTSSDAAYSLNTHSNEAHDLIFGFTAICSRFSGKWNVHTKC